MAGCSGTRETCNGWNAAACRPPSCSPKARPVPRSPASWACRRRPPAAGMRAGVLAVWRECAPPATASRHAWAPPSWPGSAGCWTAGRWRPGSTTTCGPLRASPRSSSGPPGWRTIPGTCGASSRRCGGACSAQPARPSSATRPRSPGGSPRSGRGSCKRPNAQSLALLCRRVGRQADPAGAAHLGTAGQDAGAAPPLPTRQADLDVRAGGLPAGRGPGRAAGGLHAWAATQPWLELAYLPSYAPELDPVEGLWANLKGRELANRCYADRRELIATAQVGSIRARRDPDLLRSFLAGTGLTI